MAGKYTNPEAPLPNGMIPLRSSAGQSIANDRTTSKQDSVISLFKTQVHRTFCGPASMAIVVNATNTAYKIKTEEGSSKETDKEVNDSPCEDVLDVVDEEDIATHGSVKDFVEEIDVRKIGMTLEQIQHLAMKLEYSVTTYYVNSGNFSVEKLTKLKMKGSSNMSFQSLDEFRDFINQFFHQNKSMNMGGLICNYNMATLGYIEYKGHFSPLAAYNSQRDMVLVMDVWPDTQPAWVNIELLYKAMSECDSASSLPRGLLVINHHHH